MISALSKNKLSVNPRYPKQYKLAKRMKAKILRIIKIKIKKKIR